MKTELPEEIQLTARNVAVGRPSDYTPELAREICDRLAEGEPLAEICRDKGFPHPSTVRRWATKNEELSLCIASAREDGEERITANARRTAKGDEGFSTGDVQRDKLMIDLDLKLLAKWNPKKYGDKFTADIGNKDDKPFETKEVSILEKGRAIAFVLSEAQRVLKEQKEKESQ